MFDFDAGKLVVIGVVALIVIGPKDLPRVLRQVGQAVAKLRRMAADFQAQFMEAMREADLDDIRKDVAALNSATKLGSTFNPIETVRRELNDAMIDKRPAVETSGPDQLPPTISAPQTDAVHAAIENVAYPIDPTAPNEPLMTPASPSASAALADEPHQIGGA